MACSKVQMALDAASGLCFLHELQPARIHRDIKSANLLVAEVWNRLGVCWLSDGWLLMQLHTRMRVSCGSMRHGAGLDGQGR